MTLDYPWVRIARHEDVKSGLTIELPFNRHHIVWNDVSDDSFQVIVVALDVMHGVFTGSQFTKTLATVEFDFTQPMVNFRPQWAASNPVIQPSPVGVSRHPRQTLEKHDPDVGAQNQETTPVVKHGGTAGWHGEFRTQSSDAFKPDLRRQLRFRRGHSTRTSTRLVDR